MHDTTITPDQLQVLRALETAPLSREDLLSVITNFHGDLNEALHDLVGRYLLTQVYDVVGCHSCGQPRKYYYRLTLSGRQTLNKFNNI